MGDFERNLLNGISFFSIPDGATRESAINDCTFPEVVKVYNDVVVVFRTGESPGMVLKSVALWIRKVVLTYLNGVCCSAGNTKMAYCRRSRLIAWEVLGSRCCL